MKIHRTGAIFSAATTLEFFTGNVCDVFRVIWLFKKALDMIKDRI